MHANYLAGEEMGELIFEALTQSSGDNVEGLLPDPCTAAALNVGLH